MEIALFQVTVVKAIYTYILLCTGQGFAHASCFCGLFDTHTCMYVHFVAIVHNLQLFKDKTLYHRVHNHFSVNLINHLSCYKCVRRVLKFGT